MNWTRLFLSFRSISYLALSKSFFKMYNKWHLVRHLVVQNLGFPSTNAISPKEPPAHILAMSTKPFSTRSVAHYFLPLVRSLKGSSAPSALSSSSSSSKGMSSSLISYFVFVKKVCPFLKDLVRLSYERSSFCSSMLTIFFFLCSDPPSFTKSLTVMDWLSYYQGDLVLLTMFFAPRISFSIVLVLYFFISSWLSSPSSCSVSVCLFCRTMVLSVFIFCNG